MEISRGGSGGPERRTEIVATASGREERNSRWASSKRRYNAGFGVFVVADAASSRKLNSATLAFGRLKQIGIQVLNTEMVIFEWLEKAASAEFKNLSALIK